ncbi:Na+/H+ antiporter NhaC family protein [Sinanaerobacter sp. ZZT-01]|uniref:Na+/H+ antiporter NhaC family protein n=1 Tax=Sinanaerobacter sp. ZZT-01 TaxID=3111540 RepID=UPI002D7A00F3|nr:Na+/H+ antiporter NhaC family protein [Sinanaerobacter sp. ZZT-01]WRR92131.1 Na+/H+ antiporter NhaC family protein [Sinanaerobacter sp. ZZT-01]
MKDTQKKGNPIALLPIGVFLIIFIGSGILTNDFYSMPAIVGFLIALMIAFMQNRKVSFSEKFVIAAKGVGNENIVIMCLIFLAAGGFSGAVKAAGGVESTVNLGLSVLPSEVAVVGLFLIGCFISISMGTSMGTIAALAPIAVGISEKAAVSLPICIGAVVCGAMFGDNLSMISDTTIAAVRTQGCKMKDKFKANLLIVLPAAVLTLILFLFLAKNNSFHITGALPYNIFQVLPYLLVLTGALIGFNVFGVLIAGTVASLIVGVASKAIPFSDIFKVIGDGVTGMYDITVISIVVSCIVALVKEYGGIQYILELIHSNIKGQKGGMLGIAALASMVDVATANNTVAIVMAGPIAKEISEEFDIPPIRSASILDIFTSVFQGLIPYGAQLLSAASLTGLTPFEIIPYMYYPIFMAISALLFILFSKEKKSVR